MALQQTAPTLEPGALPIRTVDPSAEGTLRIKLRQSALIGNRCGSPGEVVEAPEPRGRYLIKAGAATATNDPIGPPRK